MLSLLKFTSIAIPENLKDLDLYLTILLCLVNLPSNNFSTEYIIAETGILKVKCGFLYDKHFDIHKIKSVANTSNMISSPAPSLDRIELTYGKFDIIVISPKDKFGFARELTKVNPKIENKLTK